MLSHKAPRNTRVYFNSGTDEIATLFEMTASNIIVVFNIIHEAVLELFKCRGQSSAGSIKYVAKKTTICHSQDRIFP